VSVAPFSSAKQSDCLSFIKRLSSKVAIPQLCKAYFKAVQATLSTEANHGQAKNTMHQLSGRLHVAFSMCVSMSDKLFDAEACDIGGQASATNCLSDMKTHIENAPCNRPLK
jgi:hypothetical protein